MYEYMATCNYVADGDTIDVTLDLGFHTLRRERLRILAYDAPETGARAVTPEEKALGLAAKAKLHELLFGKQIKINTMKDKGDKYGRYLAVVWFKSADGTWLDVATEMTVAGFIKKDGMSKDTSKPT